MNWNAHAQRKLEAAFYTAGVEWDDFIGARVVEYMAGLAGERPIAGRVPESVYESARQSISLTVGGYSVGPCAAL